MFVFGGVDKRQARFADLYEFNLDLRVWTSVVTSGDVPSARTFHRAAIYRGSMCAQAPRGSSTGHADVQLEVGKSALLCRLLEPFQDRGKRSVPPPQGQAAGAP